MDAVTVKSLYFISIRLVIVTKLESSSSQITHK